MKNILEVKYNYNILWWKLKKVQFLCGVKYYNLNNLFCSNREQ